MGSLWYDLQGISFIGGHLWRSGIRKDSENWLIPGSADEEAIPEMERCALGNKRVTGAKVWCIF